MATREAVVLARFNDAIDRHDVQSAAEMMTADCIFEDTEPAPNGTRYGGREAFRKFFEDLFATTPGAAFEVEETFFLGDRAVQRWTYRWSGAGGLAGHVRGADIFRFRGGRIAEKLSYVKG
jgi:ketosteroid isomerase-like protein